ncbi:MAG: hypothetical protein LH472_05910 [Pyrinomonadaceae bacterium]|nr:hypothetical protein [Pyrinomonadaceae bacterium]
MCFHFRNLNNKDEESTGKDLESHGILRVEVPHWSSQVQIFDDSFNPVAAAEKINADPKSASGYSTETELPPGVYQIKTSLEGKTESEWVPVRPDRLTQVTTDAWDNLEFTSSTPLQQIKNADKAQIKAAQKMSRQLTWKKSKGDSGLFLFIRTSNPQKYGKTFTEGLQLYDDRNNLITDFSENVGKSASEGWLAFNADLPEGGYILRRGRRGVNVRNQVVYLCRNWQTEIFIQSRRYPSLGTMNVSMKRHRSLPQNAEAAEAAETVLNFLRYKTDVRVLLDSDKIKNDWNILLDEKFANPWLGILAAYAILKLEEEVGDEQNRETTAHQKQSFQEYFSLMNQQLIPFLEREIPSHPDVRALLLNNEKSEVLAFPFPPMLWLSLKRIQTYSIRHADIVPKNCLTDCVIDKPLVDSPWTAWNHLNRYPADFEKSAKMKTATRKALMPDKQKTRNSLPPDYGFQTRAAESDFLPQFQSDEPLSFTPDQKALQHISVIQTAKNVVNEYVESGKIKEIPEVYQLNSSEQINQMLGQVNAEQISSIYNIPLSRAESGLENLKRQGETLPATGQSDDVAVSQDAQNTVSETSLGQAIIGYAVNPATVPSDDPESRIVAKPPVKIENLVGQIRASAERLWLITIKPEEKLSSSRNISKQSSEAEKDIPLTAEESEFARSLALYLKDISDNLLSRADFIVVADSQHKIFDKNDAFLFLLLPQTLGTPSAAELVGGLSGKQARWESALASLPLGDSEINDPSDENRARLFLVRRTLIEDKRTNLQAHLNIIREKNIEAIENSTLEEISGMLSDLTLFTSLFAYGTSTGKIEYKKKLDGIVARIMSLKGL